MLQRASATKSFSKLLFIGHLFTNTQQPEVTKRKRSFEERRVRRSTDDVLFEKSDSKQSRDAINAVNGINGPEKCISCCLQWRTSWYATFNAKLMRAAVNYHLTFRYLYMASRFEFRSRFDLNLDATEIGKRLRDNFAGSRVRFCVRQIGNVSSS